MVQDEQTHFQRLDELKLEHENEQKIEAIKANAEVEKAKIQLKRDRLSFLRDWNEPLHLVLVIVGIVAVIVGAIFVFWWMWANSPEDTPEEQKQDRFSSCVYNNGDDKGSHDMVWWPDAANGQGLCLPKGEKP